MCISQSMLEEEMDECIERGELQEAVEISEKLAKREVSTHRLESCSINEQSS